MKRIFYILILSLVLASAVSAIAFLVYPDAAVNGDVREEGDSAGVEPVENEKGRNEQPGAESAVPLGRRDDETREPAVPEDDREGKKLYLILDDGGHSIDQLRRFTPFPGVFTVAVLPGLADSVEVARMTVALGHELILHQPMEAQGGNDPGPGAIYTVQRDHQIRRVLRRNLAQFPDAIGVNNHMGSKATQDRRVMEAVISALTIRDLFFLDSRTTAESVVDGVNTSHLRPPLRRDVFLDNVRTEEAISKQLDLALRLADRRGHAVMIGHVTSGELARVLLSRYDEITAAGYEFFPISDLAVGEEARLAHEDTGN